MFPLYCCTVGRVCVREKVRLAAREDIKNLVPICDAAVAKGMFRKNTIKEKTKAVAPLALPLAVKTPEDQKTEKPSLKKSCSVGGITEDQQQGSKKVGRKDGFSPGTLSKTTRNLLYQFWDHPIRACATLYTRERKISPRKREISPRHMAHLPQIQLSMEEEQVLDDLDDDLNEEEKRLTLKSLQFNVDAAFTFNSPCSPASTPKGSMSKVNTISDIKENKYFMAL
eukprot:sb/3469634/